MRSLRQKNPNNGNVVVLIATASEIEILIEALDAAEADPVNPSKREAKEFQNLRVDLMQARYGGEKHTRPSRKANHAT